MNPSLRRAIEQIKTSKRELFLQIIFVFIVPIVLIEFGFVNPHARVLVLVVLVTLLTIILLTEKWTTEMLGVHWKDIKKYAIPYAIFTLVMVLLINQFGENILQREELKEWWVHKHFLYLFFIVSLFQEIAYRGYLMPALGKLTSNPFMIIITNTMLFVFLHTIFPNLYIELPIAFFGGLGFAIMYFKYPNLPLIIVSHSILNFFVVLYGFFVVPGVTY